MCFLPLIRAQVTICSALQVFEPILRAVLKLYTFTNKKIYKMFISLITSVINRKTHFPSGFLSELKLDLCPVQKVRNPDSK